MRSLLILILLISLSSCSNQPLPPAAGPESQTRDMARPEGQLYQVDKAASEIRLVSYPEGRLGHTHVIGGPVISGDIVVAEDTSSAWLKLAINVSELLVDKPQWRRDENLDSDMSQRAINGTRDNLLSDKLLNAAAYPRILIEADSIVGPDWQKDVVAQITLVGHSREILVPVAVFEDEDNLEVIGRFEILQSDFGIEAFSALGGIVRVDDKLLIRFRIRARLV